MNRALLAATALLLALSACATGNTVDYIRCTVPTTTGCAAWVIGPPNF